MGLGGRPAVDSEVVGVVLLSMMLPVLAMLDSLDPGGDSESRRA